MSVDGFGDFVSTAWGVGRNFNNTIQDKVFFPHSLGLFYQSLTQYLGFLNYGDEYKVMGLAPLGKNYLEKEFDEIVKVNNNAKFELNLKYFRHHKNNIEFKWDNGSPIFDQIFDDSLQDLLRKKEKRIQKLLKNIFDIAFSIQKKIRKCFF